MPRRNRRPQRRRRVMIEEVDLPELSYQAMAHELVNTGKASRAILGIGHNPAASKPSHREREVAR